jgi:small redox-active disulfide protein 2
MKMYKIEVLGTGCAKCNKLEETARKAADELGVEYEVVKVKDINDIMNYGVMITPALVVNGVVKVAGKVPAVDEVKKMIQG